MKKETKPLGKVEHIKANLYKVDTPVSIGYTYTVVCPSCGKLLEATPEAEGICKVRCDSGTCVAVIGYAAEGKTHISIPNNEKSQNGMLVWGKWWPQKKYILHEGSNIIGRKDPQMHSDVEISSDSFVSRQSIDIFVSKNDDSTCRFVLNVKRLKNPLYVNNMQLNVGESIDLKFGDDIKIGKNTILEFRAAK